MSVTIGGTSGVTFNGGSTLNPDNTAPSYACRAWVNFNGTGTTGTNQTIRASGNVASVYKNGTGDYTITFTTAMPDGNYNIVFGTSCNAGATLTGANIKNGTTPAAASFNITTFTGGGTAQDYGYVNVTIFR